VRATELTGRRRFGVVTVWGAGLLRRRAGRLGAAAGGVAVAVALLASLGAFLAFAQASMTARATRTVSRLGVL